LRRNRKSIRSFFSGGTVRVVASNAGSWNPNHPIGRNDPGAIHKATQGKQISRIYTDEEREKIHKKHQEEKTTFSHQPTVAFATSVIVPVARIKPVEPKIFVKQDECKRTLSIGVFFDGTRNNRVPYTKVLGYSNIARLYEAYPESPPHGIYWVYVPGIGTPFPEIGELEHRTTGSAFALGGTERVLDDLVDGGGSQTRHNAPKGDLQSEASIRSKIMHVFGCRLSGRDYLTRQLSRPKKTIWRLLEKSI
jgi:hypothetical protein